MYKLVYDNRDNANKLWRIGIRDGNAYVDTLNLPKTFPSQDRLTWNTVLKIGEAVDCDMAFDARWNKNDTNQKWIFEALSDPWFFWVDNSKNLYTKKWTGTPTLLANNVEKISAIRGWKNVYFYNHDQGIIVTYLRSGKLYYRSYCLQPPDLPAIWEIEREILNTPYPVSDFYVFRTNDYRVGVTATSPTTTKWTLTERDWAGMSIPIERLTTSPVSVTLDFVKITYHDGFEKEYMTAAPAEITWDMGYILTDNHFVEIYNQPILVDGIEDWGKELIVRVEHGIYNLNTADFEIVDSYNRSYFANTIQKIADRTYKLSFLDLNNFNNVDKVGAVKFKGLYGINGMDTLYVPFQKVFHPQNLVPTSVPLPEVEAVWNE